MTSTPAGLASAIETELKTKKSSLGVTDAAKFDEFAEELADALGTAIITYILANTLPVVDSKTGVLT